MTITINRKRKPSKEVFRTIDDFIDYLKENYNKLNFNNDVIKSSIESIYYDLLNSEGNILYSRLNRWLPNQFGFNYKNSLQKEFWIERGFSEYWYNDYLRNNQKSRGISISKKNKSKIEGRRVLDLSITNKFKYKNTYFESIETTTCNNCKSKLDFYLRKNKKEGYYYDITGCSNKNCETNISNSKKLLWNSFLPKSISEKMISKLESNMRCNNILNIDFHINNGLTKEESIQKISEIQSKNSKLVKNRFIVSKDNLRGNGYSEEKISLICQTPTMINFWINKGLTEEESIQKISEYQKNATQFIDYEKRILPSNIEYWTHQGYNEEESKLKISERQRTFSKDICIEKYGEVEGIKIFNERTNKWQKSLNENGNMKIGYSVISQELFDILNGKLNGEFKYATNGGEFRLNKDNGGVWIYDFTDVNRKKIIEYQGDMYHGNPKIYEASDYPHPFRKNKTAQEIWEKDKIKKEVAIKNGYDVLYIWDSEYRKVSNERKELIIQKCIDFIINK